MRFVTLTLRATRAQLTDQIDRLRNHFRTLVRSDWWKKYVAGGAAVLECKIGEQSGCWHAHLHVLVEGRWLPQKELSAEWLRITGDSSIVDVRRPTDHRQLTSYLVKYVTKPADSSVYHNAERLDEMILALKGRRSIQCFGTWYKWPLEIDEPEEAGWKFVMMLDQLVERAHEGEPEARALFDRLSERYPRLKPLPLLLPEHDPPF